MNKKEVENILKNLEKQILNIGRSLWLRNFAN